MFPRAFPHASRGMVRTCTGDRNDAEGKTVRPRIASLVAFAALLLTIAATACTPWGAMPAYASATAATSASATSASATSATSVTSATSTEDANAAQYDFDSWSAIAANVADYLEQGRTAYASNDRAQAASAFSQAQHMAWNASNFAKAVSDTLGQDRYNAQSQAFQSLSRLAYQQDKGADVDAAVASLAADVEDAASSLDATADLADPRTYGRERYERIQSEREVLDANKVHKNTGKGDRTWSDVACEMNAVLDQALADAKAGKGSQGSDGVNDAYYQYYEKLGFEKNVMNAIGGDRVSKVESTFKKARNAMSDGRADEAATLIADLEDMLTQDAATLDGGAADEVNGFTKFVTSSVGQAFLVLIREGLEALLVVAAIIAYLMKSGNRRFVKWIYAGVLAGLAGSGVVAAVFMALFGGSGPQQEIMEGVCALIATAMLLWTSNWMLNKSSVEAWNRYIRTKTEAAVESAAQRANAHQGTAGTMVSLALLSFLAVFREGAETVIFYESIYAMTRDAQGMWLGGAAAAVALVAVFLTIRFTSVRIPIGPFFLVTSVLMSVLVVIFAGGGVHSLIEGDALPGMYVDGLPTNDWLGLYPYVETLVAQAVAAVAVLALFAVGFAKQRRARMPAQRLEQTSDDGSTSEGKASNR